MRIVLTFFTGVKPLSIHTHMLAPTEAFKHHYKYAA